MFKTVVKNNIIITQRKDNIPLFVCYMQDVLICNHPMINLSLYANIYIPAQYRQLTFVLDILFVFDHIAL
jgi:hypothetical protein